MMWVSWTDDGVSIICDREECMVEGAWWQSTVEPKVPLQPDHLTRAMIDHREGHWT